MFIQKLWMSLKDNDAPNWFGIAFSLFVWPVVLYWWSTRKKQSVPHLEIFLEPTTIQINGQQYDAVDFTFTNRTGCVAYVYHARLREHPRRFLVPSAAARDISGGWRELKFRTPSSEAYIHQEYVLQTNEKLITTIAISKPMDSNFYSHQPSWIRRRFHFPKYFLLQYTAMIAEKKYSVASVY